MRTAGLLAALAAVALGACGSSSDKPAVKRDPERPRRVIEPPSRGVRALPPHAIRADGVGPYKLGASTAEILDQLPSGPRIRQFTIPGIVQRDMLRGEEDGILIGTEPQGKAMFVAVVRDEIARTEAGIQVGSTREDLERALGAPVDDPDRARDPRIIVPSKLENAHVLLEAGRVAAIVLSPQSERTKDAGEQACARPPTDRKRGLYGACLTHTGEVVKVGTDEIQIVARDSEKVVALARVPGLVFAAPLRHVDGRDEVVAIVETADAQGRTWSLVVYRLVDGKLLRVIEPTPLYQLTAANARWIGAELPDLDLFLELTAKPDSIEVGGLLTTREEGAIRDIVVISPVPVTRRRAKGPAVEPLDAGLPDAQGVATPERPTPE